MAITLLGVVELCLHTDAFLQRYRSVFAVGRAAAKLHYVESHVPTVLLIGNSRVDNDFDPATLQAQLPAVRPGTIFNFGMPGADARTLYGILHRLAADGLLGPDRIANVVIGLDESFLQPGDGLGYDVFFANRAAMWQHHEYIDLLRSAIRLWGYSDNLKELREPAKLERFVIASIRSVAPLGGEAGEHLGYRAGFGGLQEVGQTTVQEAGSKRPPDQTLRAYLRRSLDLLAARKVRCAVVFPPLLNRDVLYLTPHDPAAAPYLDVASEIAARGIPLFALDPGGARVSS
jgi:hypothetical protein